jgi:hypothetical protein
MEQDERECHRQGNPQLLLKGAHQVHTETQEHTGHHGHDDRHGDRIHRPPHPARQPQAQHQHAGSEKRADYFGIAQVGERRANQHGTGNTPQQHQRLPVDQRKRDGEKAVEKKRAENPGRDIGFRQPAARAGGEDDRNRAGAGEQKADQRAQGIVAAAVGKPLAWRGRSRGWLLEQRVNHAG